MDDYRVPMINTRGRVIWIPMSQVSERKENGWTKIENPKQDYYPQYDQYFTQKKETPSEDTRLIFTGDKGDILGIISV